MPRITSEFTTASDPDLDLGAKRIALALASAGRRIADSRVNSAAGACVDAGLSWSEISELAGQPRAAA